MPRLRRTLVLGTTVPETAVILLNGQMAYLAENGWDVHLVTSPGPDLDTLQDRFAGALAVTIHPLAMHREPSPAADARALAQWVRLLRTVRPTVVMSGTPKAGLLGMVAAHHVHTPRRVYLVRGLRLEGFSGPSAAIGAGIERTSCALATHVVCTSPSLLQAMVARRLVRPSKARVLGPGSSNGVDTDLFTPASPSSRSAAREQFGLSPDEFVIGFAGRLTQDKGLPELMEALARVLDEHPGTRLLIVGDVDATDPLPDAVRQALESPAVVRLPRIHDMPAFYAALDVLCLPSRREGFPNVPLEAAASGLPVVTTDATGCVDAVVNGLTGRVVPTGQAGPLAEALVALARDPSARSGMGRAGRLRAEDEFASALVWQRTLDFLEALVPVRRP